MVALPELFTLQCSTTTRLVALRQRTVVASFIERALARMLLDVACKNVRSVDSLDCYIFVASVQSCIGWGGLIATVWIYGCF